jgi:peptide/nickel transport system substrate-binding protein
LNVPEPSNLKLMLDKGDVDWTGYLTADLAKAYERDSSAPVRIEWNPVYILTAVMMNTNYAPLGDTNVRKAIRHAINYDEIVNNIVSGIRLDRPIFKPLLGSEDRVLYGHDLAKAKRYMAQSAYPDGFDLTLTIGTGVGLGAEWQSIAAKEADDLSKIGINVKIEQYDWSIVDQKSRAGDYQAMQIWIGAQYDDPDGARARLLCDFENGFFVKPTGYRNSQIAALLEQSVKEPDSEKRAQIYVKMSELLAEDGPFAFVAQEIKPWAFRKSVKGFDGNPNVARVNQATIYREK